MSSVSPAPNKLRLQVVVAAETDAGQVADLHKFLHITNGTNDVAALSQEVNAKFKHLYPTEQPIEILGIQDGAGCDLDPAYQLFDVFEERSTARVIISDDGSSPRRRISSSFATLARTQFPQAARRDSFDSVNPYATPSLSSLNTTSPISRHRLNGQTSNGAVKFPDISSVQTPEIASEEFTKLSGRSPEIGPEPAPKPTLASTRQPKRKRENKTAIPGTPEKESPPEKKRAIEISSVQSFNASNGQDSILETKESKIPETPVDSRKRKASPQKRISPPKPKNPRKKPAKSCQDENAMQVRRVTPPLAKEPEPETPPTQEPAPEHPVIKSSPPLQKAPKKKRYPPRKKRTLAIESQSVHETPKTEEAQKTESTTKSASKGQGKKSTPVKSSPRVTPVTLPSPNPQPKRSRGKKAPVVKDPESPSVRDSETSATSQSKSLTQLSDDEELETSETSSSTSSDSESDEASESEKSEGDEESSGEKMSVDEESSSKESVIKPTSRSSSPKSSSESSSEASVRATSPKKALNGPETTKPAPTTVSRSSSVASKSSSAPKSSSESDCLGPSGSVSNAESSDAGSSPNAGSSSDSDDERSSSDSHSSQSDSDSDSESGSDSDGSDYSKASKASSAKRSSASPRSSDSDSLQSSGREASTTSSNVLVASSLGGIVEKTRPIIKRLPASQTTASQGSVSLSQQSPLIGRGSKAAQFPVLSQMSEKFAAMAKSSAPPSQPKKEASSESDSESDNENSSDESEKEENGVPKGKLAGRAPTKKTKKKSYRGLRDMFS